MRPALRLWRYLYGENPLHLLAMLGCFALVGYAVSFVYADPSVIALAIWFGGAVLGHDLVLYPLYALADQPLVIGRWARRKVLPRRPPLVPAINHVRVPVLGSAVLGLIYLPTITSHGEDALRFTSGLGTAGIYQHWLLITGVLFLGSAVVYAARLGAAARREVVERRREPALVGAPAVADVGASQAETASPETAPAPLPEEPAVVEPEPASHEPGDGAAEPEPTEPESAEPEPASDEPGALDLVHEEAGDEDGPSEDDPAPDPAVRGTATDPRSP